jgi:hypothetical protein
MTTDDSLSNISFVSEDDLKDYFLSVLAGVGYVVIAEERTGLKGRHKRWAREDAEYAARADEARDQFNGVIVGEMIRRGINGVARKKFTGKGFPVIDDETKKQYVEHEYSDRLLLALASSRMKEFRTSTQEIEHSGGIGVEHAGSLNIGGTVKHAIYTDPDYIEYLESKRLEERCNSAAVGSNSIGGTVLDAESSEVTQPGGTGDDTRGRGDSAADGNDAAEAW